MTKTVNDEWALQNTAQAVEYALEGLKAGLLINGGAAVAILAFLGSYQSAATGGLQVNVSHIRLALICFGVGVASAAATFIVAYLAQLYFAENNYTARHEKPALKWRNIGLVLSLLSLVSFVVGVILAATGFS